MDIEPKRQNAPLPPAVELWKSTAISKAEMAWPTSRTQSVVFDRYVLFATLTTNPADVRRWIRRNESSHIDNERRIPLSVGLGVQWIPGGGAGAATLQLSAGYHCLIFHLHRATNIPPILRDFLTYPGVIFVGTWNYMDAAMLRESRHRLIVEQLVDLRDVAFDVRGFDRNTFTGKLALRILGVEGVEGDEAVLRSNWEAEVPNTDQVRYACIDAFIALMMGIELRVCNWSRRLL